MAVNWASGFEYGLATPVTSGGGLFNTVSGTVAIQSTIKRSGERALKFTCSASNSYVQRTLSGSPTAFLKTLYVYFDTSLPSADCCLLRITGTGYFLNLSFKYSDSKFYVGNDEQFTTAGSVIASVDTFYRIDLKFVCSAQPWTIDWRINEVNQTQFTLNAAAGTFSAARWGAWGTSLTASVIYDDMAASHTAGDYPLNVSGVEGRRPNADGTHNNGANILEDSAGNDIDGVTYFAYDKLDDNPWVSNGSDYIRQAANGGTNYLEVLFQDTQKTNILGVMAILQYRGETATTNNGACIIIDEDATETTLWGNPTTRADYSETSCFYKSVMIPTPAGGWDQAAVNTLKARLGYSTDANPDPWWNGLILEVVYGPEGPSLQTISPGGIGSGESFGTSKANLTLPSVGGIASAEAFGTSKANFTLAPSGIGSAEELGVPKLNLALLLAAIESLEAFGTPTMILTGPQTIYPEGILTLEAFGTPRLNLMLLAQAIATAEELGVARLNFILAPAGIGTGEEHGAPKLHFRLTFSGVETGEAFGLPAVSLLSGPQYVLPEAIVSEETFGQPGLSLRLYASGVASGESFGESRIALYLNPAAIASLEAVGAPKINFALLAQAIESAEAVGTPSLAWNQVIEAGAIGSEEALGLAIVLGGKGTVFTIGGMGRAPAGFGRTAPGTSKRAAPAALRREN